ncbi:MAG: PAS domain S-box protein, partial [Acidobacteria bacterium]|nr:PAS domain S-box protein [Acidobacteriota bacterium]
MKAEPSRLDLQSRRRQMALATLGLVPGLLLGLLLQQAGILGISLERFGGHLLVTVVVQGWLLWLSGRAPGAWRAWDRKFLYVPMVTYLGLLTLYGIDAPAARYLILIGFACIFLFLSPIATTRQVVIASAIMAASYSMMLVSAFRKIPGLDMVFEGSLLALILITSAYAAMVTLQTQRSRRRRRDRAESLTRLSPVGIFRSDLEGRCTYVNQRWSEITGLSRELAMGEGWLRAVHPNDRQRVVEDWQQFRHAEELTRIEYRFFRGNGEIVWVLGQAVFDYDPEGRHVGFVGTITDITPRIEAQQAAEQANRAKGEFLAN